MLRFAFLAAVGGVVVLASGVLDDGPAQVSLLLLPLSAALAYGVFGSQ